MYAVVEIGGRQYRVEPGETLVHEYLPGHETGQKVVFDRVLLLRDEGTVEVGRPYLTGVKVVGEIEQTGRLPKVVVQRFKPKKGYRRKKGYRQPYMRTRIKAIKKG